MPVINRVRVSLTGFTGGPGVSTFYCLDPVTFLPALKTFYEAVKPALPLTVAVSFPGTGDMIEATTGVLTGSWVAAAPLATQGTGPGAYAAPIGAVCNWVTNSIINGHRVIGRTYLVPLVASNFDIDGTIAPANRLGFEQAASQLVSSTGANFVVWSRPRAAGVAPPVRPLLPARAGGYVSVTASGVPDLAAVLTSRRD